MADFKTASQTIMILLRFSRRLWVRVALMALLSVLAAVAALFLEEVIPKGAHLRDQSSGPACARHPQRQHTITPRAGPLSTWSKCTKTSHSGHTVQYSRLTPASMTMKTVTAVEAEVSAGKRSVLDRLMAQLEINQRLEAGRKAIGEGNGRVADDTDFASLRDHALSRISR